jgi:hypothetical protein
MENLDALLAIPLLKQPLADSFRVFSNPVKILQWILPSKSQNSKEFSSPVPVCTMSQCPPGRVSFHRTFSSSVFFCAPMHLLNAHLEKLSKSSVIMFLSELTVEFLLCALLAPARCPLGRASQNSSEILSLP